MIVQAPFQRAGAGGNPAAAAIVPLSEHFGEEPKGSYPLAYLERSAPAGKLGGNAEVLRPRTG